MRISDWSSDVCSADLFCKCFEDCCALKNNISASRRRTRIRIGPAISRRDQTHFSESEIQHGTCCLANILAQLRPHENNDRGDRYHRSFLLSSRWTSRGDRIARRSEKDPSSRVPDGKSVG